MLADSHSLAALDFVRICERVAGQTHAAQARERALALEPSSDPELVAALVAQTTEMRWLVRTHNFAPVRTDDVDAALDTAARGASISALELRAIADALAAATAAVRAIREADDDLPALRTVCADFLPLPTLVTRVHEAIDERGVVLDRASPELARTRRQIASAQDDARERTAHLARSGQYAKALQDAIVTVRDGRFVVPVKVEYAGTIAGIVHDTSASGQTIFVEPLETLEINNRVRALRAQEEHEVARILAALSALVGGVAQTVRRDVATYVEIDLAFARAAVAERMGAVTPELVADATIDVRNGRHPLLDERAVPQSIVLDEAARITIVSGPNMGGKTVALKMIGLFVAMVGCGMHLPAQSATIGHFTRIFTDIGDEQSIAQNASTFSAHLRRLAEIVAAADGRSLILIDEIGSGTEPNAGAALAIAVLERFLAVGARAIVTTHATELKLFGADRDAVRNASVRFDPETYAPTFQLDIGSPGQSLAFALARRMQLDPAVIARAESLLSEQERDYERALAELAHERTRATSEREALERERVHLRILEDQERKRIDALEKERNDLGVRAEHQLAASLHQFVAELERRAASAGNFDRRVRVTRGQSELLAKTIEEVRAGLGIDPTKTKPQRGAPPIGVGDRVVVLSLDTEGVVAEDHGAEAVVVVGAMRMNVPKKGLRRKGAPATSQARERSAHQEGSARAGAAKLAAASTVRAELDVRGKRYAEAEPLVERWIDESMMAGASPLRLIHGKGTGLLGRGLQEYLRGHSGVTNVRYGAAEEGGSGVTVFELT